jgi:site-specific DNA recombinase
MTAATIRAAIYCRISRDREGEALGIDRQLKDCRALAARLGWQVVSEYSDNDISAYSGKPRPDYRRMLADIEAGAIDAIIVWKTSRLYRRLKDLIELIDLFNEHGLTTIQTVKAGTIDLSTSAGRTTAVILARIDQQASEDTSDLLRRQRLQAAEMGWPHTTGARHFGFQQWVVKQERTKPVPGNAVPMRRVLKEQEWAREAVARIVAGDSIRGVTQDWNRRKIRTTTDGEWRRQSLRKMLLSPTLAGYRAHNGAIIRNEDGTPMDAAWAPIVDRADWWEVVSILTDPGRTTTHGAGPAYLLSGFVWCGGCGSRMRAKVEGRKREVQYRCESSRPHAPPGRLARQVALVDRQVEQDLFDRIKLERLQATASLPDDDQDQSGQVYAELARLQGRLDRLDDSETTAEADGDARKVKSIRRVRTATEREMDELRSRLDARDGERVRARIPANLESVWPDLSLDRRRAIVAAVVDFVIILPAGNYGRHELDPKSVVTIFKNRQRWPGPADTWPDGGLIWPDGAVLPDPVRAGS